MAASGHHKDLKESISFNTQPPEGGCGWYPAQITESEMFQHTATRRWLPKIFAMAAGRRRFQHTATRRWLHLLLALPLAKFGVSTHSHPKVAATYTKWVRATPVVSTHSHPKVAAVKVTSKSQITHRFNTQPPEGGCILQLTPRSSQTMFQHTATRRWLLAVVG